MLIAAVCALIFILVTDAGIREAAVTILIALVAIMTGAVLLFQKMHQEEALGFLIGAVQFFSFILFGLWACPVSAALFMLLARPFNKYSLAHAVCLSALSGGLFWLDEYAKRLMNTGQFILDFSVV